jgi:hypothetical protein
MEKRLRAYDMQVTPMITNRNNIKIIIIKIDAIIIRCMEKVRVQERKTTIMNIIFMITINGINAAEMMTLGIITKPTK